MNESYVVLGPSINHPFVEAWSKERLPFEPKGWKLRFRNAIRRALKKLNYVHNLHLTAVYISPIKQYFDVENIVFYNVGSAYFAHLARNGIRFEHVFSQPPPTPKGVTSSFQHYVSYSLIERSIEWANWHPVRMIAQWSDVPCNLSSSTLKVSSVWLWLKIGITERRVCRSIESAVSQTTNMGLKATIHAPVGLNFNLTSLVKPLFDGIVAAFHRHDSSNADPVSERLASDLGLDQGMVKSLLADEKVAVLGKRRLVWPRSNGIQWNPNDELLVVGELCIADGNAGRECRISGELFEVVRPGNKLN